jgi:hypothetical protein
MMIPNAVAWRPGLTPEAKLVYGYLKWLGWRDRCDETAPSRDELAVVLGVSERTAKKALDQLVETGLLTMTRRGLGKTNTYTIYDPDSPASGTEETQVPERKNLPVPARARSFQDLDVKTKNPPMVPPGEPRPANWPATVDRKTVTPTEYRQAAIVLDEFNRLALTKYSGVDWIRKIVSRLREHPELTVDAHLVVIERALAEPWWKGPPSPSVVYGNSGVFERAVHAVRVAPAPRGMTPDEMRDRGR